MELVFNDSEEKCYVKGESFTAGDYKVTHFLWSLNGSILTKESHWRAYKRIDCLEGRPFGDYVDPEHTSYKTRRQAEKACQKHNSQ